MCRNLLRLSVALTVCAALAACGGGGGGGGSSSGGGSNGGGGGGGGATTTRVVMNVDWPARSSRSINALSSAQSIKVVLKGANTDNSDFVWVADRDADITAHTAHLVSTSTARVGHWTAALTLYAQAGGTGDVVGTAGQDVDLKADGTGLDNLVVSGVVSSVSVPPNQVVPINGTAFLVFEARDSNNNLVAVTRGSGIWQQVSGQSSVQLQPDGSAKGIANGTASVKVTVDGKTSAPADVTVGAEFGTLNVTVKDPFGSLVPGVGIDLIQIGLVQQHVDSATGSESIQTRLIGPMIVKASKPGYTEVQSTITLDHNTPGTVNLVLQALGQPSASNGGSNVISNNGTTLVFTVDVSVIDASGNPITGLPNSAFTMDPTKLTIVGDGILPVSNVQLQDVTYTAGTARGTASAYQLLDASGSVASISDPNAIRIQAVKSYFTSLGGGDSAMLGYFPSADATPHAFSYDNPGFVTDGSPYIPLLDQVKTKSLSGSPVYSGALDAIDKTASLAPGSNKNVVIFTDGQPTIDPPTSTLPAVVTAANAKGVHIFTAGLTNTAAVNVLAELAQQTGGSSMLADNAGQLVGFYKNLSNLLRGNVSFYRTKWALVRSSGTFQVGDAFYGTILVNASGTTMHIPFVVHVNK